jgi:hypothetical protein
MVLAVSAVQNRQKNRAGDLLANSSIGKQEPVRGGTGTTWWFDETGGTGVTTGVIRQICHHYERRSTLKRVTGLS